jgi:hypothetical protein
MNAACTIGQAFDRPDAIARMRDGQRQARVDPPVIDKNRARAALAAIAALLRSGETDVFAQRVEQRDARLERQVVIVTIDVETHRHR